MPRILIVDDSETLRKQLGGILKDAGHTVEEASDGIQGFEKAQLHSDIKLIICDVNMPQIDGITMCAKIRTLPGHNKTAIFVLTSETSPALKQRAREIFLTAWIVKPFNSDNLLKAVNKVLSSPQPQ